MDAPRVRANAPNARSFTRVLCTPRWAIGYHGAVYRRISLGAFVFLVGSVAACNAILGIDDPRFTPGVGPGGGGPDGSNDPDAVGGGLDGADGVDAPRVPAPPIIDANSVSDVYRKGTRLSPKWLRTYDGNSEFTTWFDTKLQIDCTFRLAKDNKVRCLPTQVYGTLARVTSCTGAEVLFKSTGAGCPDTKYYEKQVGDSCPAHSYLLPVTTANPGPYYQPDTNPCQTTTGPAGTQAFNLGPEVPSTEFVEGIFSEFVPPSPGGGAPGASRAVARFVTGSDGSYGFYEWRDKPSDLKCYQEGSQAGLRCFPEAEIGYDAFYIDGACTQKGIRRYSPPFQCAKPKYTRYVAVSVCGPQTNRFYNTGDALTGIDYYNKYTPEGPCSHQGTTDAYNLGGEIPITDLAPFTEQVPAGTTRIRPVNVVTKDGTVQRIAWFDSKRNERCTFAGFAGRDVAADGKRRCLPDTNNVTVFSVFSDGGCTLPLKVVYRGGGCSLPKPAVGILREKDGCGGGRIRVYGVGAPRTAGYFSKDSSGTCKPSSPSAGTEYWEVGAEVPLTEFEELIEPPP
jgi:hypothetical protein